MRGRGEKCVTVQQVRWVETQCRLGWLGGDEMGMRERSVMRRQQGYVIQRLLRGEAHVGRPGDGTWMSRSVSQVWFPGKPGILGDCVCGDIW